MESRASSFGGGVLDSFNRKKNMSNKVKIHKKRISPYEKIINPLTGADADMTKEEKQNSNKVFFECNPMEEVYEFRTYNMDKYGKRNLIMYIPSDEDRHESYGMEMLVQLVVTMLRRETDEPEGMFMVETSPDNGEIKYVFYLSKVEEDGKEESGLMYVKPVVDNGHEIKYRGKPFRFNAESLTWVKEEPDV